MSWLGLAIYYTRMVFYFHYTDATVYTSVVPSQPAESILEAWLTCGNGTARQFWFPQGSSRVPAPCLNSVNQGCWRGRPRSG